MATPRKSAFTLSELYRRGVGTGRPPIFNKPEKMTEMINEYFEACEEVDQPPAVTGLSLFCGFASRSSFYQYKNEKPEFMHITGAAHTLIANWHEINAAISDRPQGSIFLLKNFGFSDTQTIEHKGKAEVRQSFRIGKTVIEF